MIKVEITTTESAYSCGGPKTVATGKMDIHRYSAQADGPPV